MALFSVTPLGVVTADTSAIKADFEAAYKSALGADLNTDVSTPQGQLIMNDTKMLAGVMNEVVNVANSFSVYTSVGQELDIAAAFFGYYRKTGAKTVVSGMLSGLSGTCISAGSLAGSGDNAFALLDDVVIGTDGTAAGQFQCTVSGPVACVTGTLDTILTPVQGWDGISNETDGILGFETESDNEFRTRVTANWLNIRAKSMIGAIHDNIAALPDVVSVLCRENCSDKAAVVDGVALAPHSVFVCVLGSEGEEIAKELTFKKTIGAGTNGNTQVSYYDETTGYNYIYKIRRPDFINIKVQVEYASNYYTPADIETKIKETLMQYIRENPFKIGQTISGYALGKALEDINYFDLLSLKAAFADQEEYGDFIKLTVEQVAVLSLENITVTEVS